jgi:hypothetical protein
MVECRAAGRTGGRQETLGHHAVIELNGIKEKREFGYIEEIMNVRNILMP